MHDSLGQRAAGSGQRAAGSGQRAAGSGQRAAGSGQRAAGSAVPSAGRQQAVLVAVRSAGALHRLLDVLPVFDGDERIAVRFTLVPGSAFDVDALAALERSGARTVGWDEARGTRHDLILTASTKGALRVLSGPRVVLPHGAGYNKTVGGDGSPHLPSGLDPHYLLADGEPWATLHALAHDDQLTRLGTHCPAAAARATVVGDPTLDRLLGSLAHREDYRSALGTGGRRLVVLTSTWGPESLLARRPELPGELVARLPHDAYQLALVLHPNEHSRIGTFDLTRHLAPALTAGLVLAGPYEEWAALLVAADAVVTDHGSTALYAAALGRPLIGAYDGGSELIPGSPMDRLLARVPRLAEPSGLESALDAAAAQETRGFADAAFALPGRCLPRLRQELYRLLGLRPRAVPVAPRALPRPAAVPRRPAALAVRAEVDGRRIRVTRFPPYAPGGAHHLSAEHPEAGPRQTQSAAVLWRRARPASGAPHSSTWTAAGWTARVLDDFPFCTVAAAVLTPERCLVRHRLAGLFSLRIEPDRTGGRILRADPACVLSAVHAWLAATPRPPSTAPLTTLTSLTSLVCDTGPVAVRFELRPAEESDLGYEL
ncbi:translation initiation factor 2 [Streptomyces yaizuensis]|uniref:Translation initiation factor 2 n=1 Tax=Streptomyces yaizuensis TaxID=2989713 RepID=A0ABQ5P257_9ACTN|nr:translation initiation factor 2 [Streptomyces sp. YSPA8]GLF96560.1 translation initiation factor 2 [Streptomyces sp. YSPA8]